MPKKNISSGIIINIKILKISFIDRCEYYSTFCLKEMII